MEISLETRIEHYKALKRRLKMVENRRFFTVFLCHAIAELNHVPIIQGNELIKAYPELYSLKPEGRTKVWFPLACEGGNKMRLAIVTKALKAANKNLQSLQLNDK